ncbi:MAG: acyl-ACP--UDP-N-acetylglucosamine O-acyltransferase [Chthoniobacterales bacterium]
MIHPTAVIDEAAQLGADVEVGPYAIIGPHVKLGDGCRVMGHTFLTGHVTMGPGNVIGFGSVIGADPQDFAFDPSTRSDVIIGAKNVFREYVTIHRGTAQDSSTVVGDGNYIMTGVHLGHNVRVGNRTVIANNVLLAGYVEIGDQSVLGGGTVFHQFMRVGRLCMVRGGTRFGKDIPPFLLADRTNVVTGLNSIGLRRAGLSAETRAELKRLFRLLFASGLNVSQALEMAEGQSWGSEAREMLQFVREAKKRGICRASVSARGDSSADE